MRKLLLLLIIVPVFLSALENIDTDVHNYIMNIKEAGEPKIFDRLLLLTYESDKHVRNVSAAFGHEDFTEIHTFQKNPHGIYFLLYTLPIGKTSISYRIRVDGLWMINPYNAEIDRNNGIPLSVLTIPYLEEKLFNSIAEVNSYTVEFRYTGKENLSVYISGDFNQWDPFMNPMIEKEPGYYTAKIHLLPGRHYYYLVVQGQRMLDPQNPQTTRNQIGETLNFFEFGS